jgi:menaquinone-dependent protoporphyrinogen oxidase
MTRILVAYASRHGATQQTAEDIGSILRGRLTAEGDVVVVSEVARVSDLDSYDVVVLGSAIYLARWSRPARHFAKKYWPILQTKSLWLFSVGRIGPAPTEGGNPDPLGPEAMTRVRGHRTFPGKLDLAVLGPIESIAVRMVKAPAGDYRDPAQVGAWANEIADALRPAPQPT